MGVVCLSDPSWQYSSDSNPGVQSGPLSTSRELLLTVAMNIPPSLIEVDTLGKVRRLLSSIAPLNDPDAGHPSPERQVCRGPEAGAPAHA